MLLDFNGFATGTIMSNQYPSVSIVGEAKSGRGGNDAMIFDSKSPTGGDYDHLGFENQWGILILSEDHKNGGTFTFTFSSAVRLDSVMVLNNQEGVDIEMKDIQGNRINSRWIDGKGPNSEDFVRLGSIQGVKTLEIHLEGPGAIDNLRFAVPCI